VDAHRTELTTRGGVRVIRTATAFDPVELDRIATIVDERRGGVMSSGMEYPGRYSRWVMAYADPCAEITATGRRITARALNDRGLVLLPVIRAAMERAGQPQPPGRTADHTVVIPEPDREFTEEERSRRPTVFSALREIAAAFGCAANARPGSGTWSCTCPTRSGCWIASVRRRSGTPMSSRQAASRRPGSSA